MFIFTDCIYPNPGGAENLVYQIVKELLIKHNQSSMIIGDSNAYVVKRLVSENIPFRFVNLSDCNEISTVVDANDVIVLFGNPVNLGKIINFPCKVIVWGLLPQEIIGWNRYNKNNQLTRFRFICRYFTQKLIGKLVELNGLISIDGNTSDSIGAFINNRFKIPIVPVPIDTEYLAKTDNSFNSDNVYRISYIGRSEDIWKIKPLKKIVSDLSKIKNIKFNIAIYTNHKEPFMAELSQVLAENISICFHFGLFGEDLRKHLNQNSYLHFSMATSALEGALAGVPTILIDPSIHDLPENYRYHWLYESDRYSLGRFIDTKTNIDKGVTLLDIINLCTDQIIRDNIADNCRRYVIENHSVSSVVDKLILLDSHLHMKDIKRYTPAQWQLFLKQ